MSDYAWICHACGAANDKGLKRCGKCSSPMTMSFAEIEARKNPPPQLNEDQSPARSSLHQPVTAEIKPPVPSDAVLDARGLRCVYFGIASAPLGFLARRYLFPDLISLDHFVGWFLIVTISGFMLLAGLAHILGNKISRVMVPIAGGRRGSDFLYDQATVAEVKIYLWVTRVGATVLFFTAALISMTFSKAFVYLY